MLISACGSQIDGLTENERDVVRAMAQPVEPPLDSSNSVLALGAPAVTLGQRLFFDPDLSGPLLVAQDTQPSPLTAPDGGSGVGVAGLISCADCHSPTHFFSDDRSAPNNVSLGAKWTPRNSPTLVNVAFYQVGAGSSWFAWDGRSDSLWMQCDVAYEAAAVMNGKRLLLARTLWQKYRDDYDQLFPAHPLDPRLDPASPDAGDFVAPDAGVPAPAQAELDHITANASKLLAAYLTQLTGGDSAFDRFARGDEAALSDPQLRGLKLFLGKAGCIECHNQAGFTDLEFHDTGVAQEGPQVPETDDGRFAGLGVLAKSPFNLVGPHSDLLAPAKSALATEHYPPAPAESDRGTFRTKSLRNVAQTGPYMHAGQLQTLADVVRFYNQGGGSAGFSGAKSVLMQPLGLADDEVDDLVAFLEALTGSPPPAQLSCDNSRRAPGAKHRFTVCGGQP